MPPTTQNEQRTHPAVLIIDDDPNGLRAVSDMLIAAGYRTAVAFGADDALRKLRRQRFDIAVVELAMKQTSGIRLIEMIKADGATADTAVVALTAPIRRTLARALGCDGLVFRPIIAADLLHTLAQVGARRAASADGEPVACRN